MPPSLLEELCECYENVLSVTSLSVFQRGVGFCWPEKPTPRPPADQLTVVSPTIFGGGGPHRCRDNSHVNDP
jgi:hypothetical protein